MRILTIEMLLFASALGALALGWSLDPQKFAGRDLFLGLTTSYVVTVFFYFLVIWWPTQRKRRRVKRSLIAKYQQTKEEILQQILFASGRYGEAQVEEILDPMKFTEFFSGSSEASQRWYDLLNGLDENYVREIVIRLELLRAELQFALLAIDVDDDEVFTFLRRLDDIAFRMGKTGADYDGQKSWGRFLWALYSSWDPAVGNVPYDRNLRLLQRL